MPELPERSLRLVVAADAKALGWGGITFIHHASGVSRVTIKKGVDELEKGVSLAGERNRQPGGGRKKLIENDTTLAIDLLDMVADASSGNPESPLQWTHKSTRALARELAQKNHPISHTKVSQLLKENGYRLQSNRKSAEGVPHPDRDEQFQYINTRSKEYILAGDPVISVDTKKKELAGNYKNHGRTWLPKGKPINVNTHDFPDKESGKAVPYGICDIGRNDGYVNVGVNHDTGKFAVSSIQRWWEHFGKERYPASKQILVTADAGGSNGYRLRLWKKELQRFANKTGLEITVCHFPPEYK